MEQVNQVNTVSTAYVEPFPTMNWGAIVAGWTATLGIAALLYLGGLALGLSSIHAHAGAGTAKAFATGAAIWTLLTWAGALFVGGLFASWFDGRNDTMMGAMHGLAVWGLTIAIALVLLALGGHRMHRPSMSGSMGDSMHGMMMTEHGGRVAADIAILHAQLVRAVHRDGGAVAPRASAADVAAEPEEPTPGDTTMPMPARGPHGGDGLAPVEMALVHDDDATAKALLVATSRLSDAEADSVLQTIAPQVDRTRTDVKQAAANAAHRAAAVAAVGFLAILFGMLTSLLGGWTGANHVHKVYHLRRYTRVDPARLDQAS